MAPTRAPRRARRFYPATATVLALVAVAAAALVACSSSQGPAPHADAGPDALVEAGPDAPSDGSTCVPSPDTGAACTPYVSCASLTTPAVTFSTDVLPVFQGTCAAGGTMCHGDPARPQAWQIYMGGSDSAALVAGLVGQPSAEDPALDIVVAGDPAHSYLMHKLDGDQCQFASHCSAAVDPLFAGCGARMPFAETSLSLATRDTIRRWIAQGAHAE